MLICILMRSRCLTLAFETFSCDSHNLHLVVLCCAQDRPWRKRGKRVVNQALCFNKYQGTQQQMWQRHSSKPTKKIKLKVKSKMVWKTILFFVPEKSVQNQASQASCWRFGGTAKPLGNLQSLITTILAESGWFLVWNPRKFPVAVWCRLQFEGRIR